MSYSTCIKCLENGAVREIEILSCASDTEKELGKRKFDLIDINLTG